MISIDGTATDLDISSFNNLEELLVRAAADPSLNSRVITEVTVNGELFSELYPHQSEDIAAEDLQTVALHSIPLGEMAVNMSGELHKVSELLVSGSRTVARLFRQADDDEALEILQDLLDVSRDFMSMLAVLRAEFALQNDDVFNNNVEKLSSLLGEMTEVLESEDWILLADLLEYEYVPLCENWKSVILSLQEKLRLAVQR